MKPTTSASEHAEQVAIVQWLTLHHITFCAVPNAGKRSHAAANSLRAEGLQAGFPDLLIFTVPPAREGACGVALEMKSRSKTARLEPLQKHWAGRLIDCGWVVLCTFGAKDAVDQLRALGYGR